MSRTLSIHVILENDSRVQQYELFLSYIFCMELLFKIPFEYKYIDGGYTGKRNVHGEGEEKKNFHPQIVLRVYKHLH